MIESPELDGLDELVRLREAVPPMSPRALARARIALAARARPRRARRLVLGGVVTAGAVAVAVAVAVATNGTPPQSQVSATQVLDLAASAVSGQVNPVVHPGQFSYTDWIDAADPSNHAPARHEQDWVPVDGKGLVTIHVTWSFGSAPMNISTPYGNGCPNGITKGCVLRPPLFGQPTYDYLAALPTDPSALRTVIYRQAQQQTDLYYQHSPNAERMYNVDQQAFELIGLLVTRSYLPPTIRVALYRVAAMIPGVTTVNDVVDGAGRHGIGVRRDLGDGTWWTLIFDRSTYQVLGSQFQEGPRNGVDVGALVHSGIVDHAG